MVNELGASYLQAVRETLTEQDYIDLIWKTRYPQGQRQFPIGKWPFERISNVVPLRIPKGEQT